MTTCQGYFFDGLDQLSRPSHGVYEGNYWQLLGDMSELEDMLARMTRAPVLLQEPSLELPPQPDLPKYVTLTVQVGTGKTSGLELLAGCHGVVLVIALVIASCVQAWGTATVVSRLSQCTWCCSSTCSNPSCKCICTAWCAEASV